VPFFSPLLLSTQHLEFSTGDAFWPRFQLAYIYFPSVGDVFLLFFLSSITRKAVEPVLLITLLHLTFDMRPTMYIFPDYLTRDPVPALTFPPCTPLAAHRLFPATSLQ